ncbi:Phosphorylase b kinase gamma catalytic chain, skeletal muscle/heart isoform [Recurvomyces mirabilis]|nr:Phosphorylase b kinase gamma catalytic chain, skeletal muscle/heart isoform [Recurvomyces mirabilis]
MITSTRARSYEVGADPAKAHKVMKRKRSFADEGVVLARPRKALRKGICDELEGSNDNHAVRAVVCKPKSRRRKIGVRKDDRAQAGLPTPDSHEAASPTMRLSSHSQFDGTPRSTSTKPPYRDRRVEKSETMADSAVGCVTLHDNMDQPCRVEAQGLGPQLDREVVLSAEEHNSGLSSSAETSSKDLTTGWTRTLDGMTRSEAVTILGTATTPPIGSLESFEYVAPSNVDFDFAKNVALQVERHESREFARRYKYGADIAEEYRRGMTPEEARETWKVRYEQQRAEADELTESEPESETARGLQLVMDTISSQSKDLQHHRKFLRPDGGIFGATMSPQAIPETFDESEGYTTEADQSDNGTPSPSACPCYVFSLEDDLLPFQIALGYQFGVGDLGRFPEHGGTDLLLPSADFETDSTDSMRSDFVYPRHGHFGFDPAYGRFWLHARHRGVRLNDRPLPSRTKILLPERAYISIGPHRFIFEFKVMDKTQFQADIDHHLANYHGQEHVHQVTSATPSSSDVRIANWVLHGVVGATVTSTIHAASDVRSGEVVAVKRLRFGLKGQEAEREVQLYKSIREAIEAHRYRSFVMQTRDILQNEQAHSPVSEVYLLWTPLAQGDFSQFGLLGRWRSVAEHVKRILFVQVVLGLLALHDGGWIHRDLKPSNIGVVKLGASPRAVIIDEGQAIRQTTTGHKAKPKTCGTIGYLAPELENDNFAPSYGKEIDIWSMGAVGYFTLLAGKLPWGCEHNMFRRSDHLPNPDLETFRETHITLLDRSTDSIELLLGLMLVENPRRRINISSILEHPSVQDCHREILIEMESSKSTGQKRSQDVLLSRTT